MTQRLNHLRQTDLSASTSHQIHFIWSPRCRRCPIPEPFQPLVDNEDDFARVQVPIVAAYYADDDLVLHILVVYADCGVGRCCCIERLQQVTLAGDAGAAGDGGADQARALHADRLYTHVYTDDLVLHRGRDDLVPHTEAGVTWCRIQSSLTDSG
jgi:hypothetical protein